MDDTRKRDETTGRTRQRDDADLHLRQQRQALQVVDGGFLGVPVTGKHDEGKIGGSGFQKNWERALRRAQRKLGIKVKYEEDEEE